MTQQQMILAIMCKQPNKWFYPYEFMLPELGDLFVGYKAPTRIAELHKKYPTLFERKSEDKYMQRRLNMNRYNEWYFDLDPEFKMIVEKYLNEPLPNRVKEPAGKAVSWLDKDDL